MILLLETIVTISRCVYFNLSMQHICSEMLIIHVWGDQTGAFGEHSDIFQKTRTLASLQLVHALYIQAVSFETNTFILILNNVLLYV